MSCSYRDPRRAAALCLLTALGGWLSAQEQRPATPPAANRTRQLRIAVVGDDPTGKALLQLSGKRFGERELVVIATPATDAARPGRAGFAAAGGAVQLGAKDNCLRFEIHAETLERQGLRADRQRLKKSPRRSR